MTDLQKDTIRAMRLQGISYVKIGEELGLSDNTVRSYCRRNGLGEKAKNTIAWPTALQKLTRMITASGSMLLNWLWIN